MGEHLLGFAAQQQGGHTAPAVRGHHDQVGGVGLGVFEDRLPRVHGLDGVALGHQPPGLRRVDRVLDAGGGDAVVAGRGAVQQLAEQRERVAALVGLGAEAADQGGGVVGAGAAGEQAAVRAAEAMVTTAKLDLEFTQIRAPISGRVSDARVTEGNLNTGGTSDPTLLTTIVSLDPIHLNFDVSEQDFLAYQRAAASGRLTSTRDQMLQVAAHLTDEKDWSLNGTMDFVNNEVDRTTGTIRARAVFPNEKLLITPGQFGRVRIPGSDPYQAVLIPDSAILSDQSQKIVMAVKADGTVEPRVVRPGPLIDGLRVIREGLTGEDDIVIDGLLRARPGAKVAPSPGKIEAKPEN